MKYYAIIFACIVACSQDHETPSEAVNEDRRDNERVVDAVIDTKEEDTASADSKIDDLSSTSSLGAEPSQQIDSKLEETQDFKGENAFSEGHSAAEESLAEESLAETEASALEQDAARKADSPSSSPSIFLTTAVASLVGGWLWHKGYLSYLWGPKKPLDGGGGVKKGDGTKADKTEADKTKADKTKVDKTKVDKTKAEETDNDETDINDNNEETNNEETDNDDINDDDINNDEKNNDITEENVDLVVESVANDHVSKRESGDDYEPNPKPNKMVIFSDEVEAIYKAFIEADQVDVFDGHYEWEKVKEYRKSLITAVKLTVKFDGVEEGIKDSDTIKAEAKLFFNITLGNETRTIDYDKFAKGLYDETTHSAGHNRIRRPRATKHFLEGSHVLANFIKWQYPSSRSFEEYLKSDDEIKTVGKGFATQLTKDLRYILSFQKGDVQLKTRIKRSIVVKN